MFVFTLFHRRSFLLEKPAKICGTCSESAENCWKLRKILVCLQEKKIQAFVSTSCRRVRNFLFRVTEPPARIKYILLRNVAKLHELTEL